MKKSVCILAFLILSGAVGLYGKKISVMMFEKPESKTVRFSVFAGTDYSTSLYKKSKAKVILSIYKYRGNSQQLVWEGMIDQGNIKNYPTSEKPLFREVSVKNVYDRKEKLAAFYTVIYDSKGSKLSYEDGINLSDGNATDSLRISI